MTKVEKFTGHPGFYCIIDRNKTGKGMDWNLYLHKDGSIQTFVGLMIQKPDEMSGLWNSKETAEQFLAEWKAKRIPR